MTAWVRGVYRPGGQGSNVYVLCAERKDINIFRPGTRPGGSVTGVTEKLFVCQIFMCLFWPPEIIQIFRLRNWLISSADFPDSDGRDRAPFWLLLAEGV